MKNGLNDDLFNVRKDIYGNGTQTSSILPLYFGMVEENRRQAVFDNLVENIMVKSDGHIGTGLIGGQWLMRTLSDNGRADIAYKLASNRTYPSWGYMIDRGATTVWELWNGDTANPSMNSRNHLMLLGDFVIWIYEHLAGIKTDEQLVGFKKIIIRPTVCGDLSFVNARYNSMRGEIVSNWRVEGDVFYLDVTIPANATAKVYIPTSNAANVTESGSEIDDVKDVKFIGIENHAAVYNIGSGSYYFAAGDVNRIDMAQRLN